MPAFCPRPTPPKGGRPGLTGKSLEGRDRWTLKLLAGELVRLDLVGAVSLSARPGPASRAARAGPRGWITSMSGHDALDRGGGDDAVALEAGFEHLDLEQQELDLRISARGKEAHGKQQTGKKLLEHGRFYHFRGMGSKAPPMLGF